MEPVLSRDPRTGEVRARVGAEADTAAVDRGGPRRPRDPGRARGPLKSISAAARRG